MAAYRMIPGEPVKFERVYQEQGLNWREAKKAARQWYMTQIHNLRQFREKDVPAEHKS